MSNTITEEHLKDIFATETWQDLFTTLSDSFGFSLNVYSQTGSSLFVPQTNSSPCRYFRSSSTGRESPCKSHCHPRMISALSTGKPDVFKCYAKLMSFVLPIEYRGGKAVILGQGSFSSYEDFRASMNLVTSRGLDAISITTPLTFTGEGGERHGKPASHEPAGNRCLEKKVRQPHGRLLAMGFCRRGTAGNTIP